MEKILTEEFFKSLAGEVAAERLEAEERKEKRTIEPTLVVGLGGTGAEVASRLKQRLWSHYESLGTHFDMIKFLIFDTIALSRHPNREVPKTFSETDEEYLCLSTAFNAFAYLQENYAKDKDLRDWWDNRYSVSPQYQEYGAKRVRQLGRLFLHHKHLQVEALIQQKVSDTCTLYEDLVHGQNLADVGNNFRVYVITSTCGGTGSGIFLDILYKIWRAVITQGRIPEIRAFMFMPGIYEEEARKRSLELVQAHRANAYAFLKELDYFLMPGSDLNNFILDSKTRDNSQKVSIPPGNLVKYGYIIDRQLGNLGNLDKPQDAYNLVSDALYQMIITPVGQEEEGVGLTNIDAIVDPTHLRDGKRTAYSSLGLSRILFPRNTLHAHLTYRFLADLIFQGFTANQEWMEEVVSKDGRFKTLKERLGSGNLEVIDALSRPSLDFIGQTPSRADLQSTELSARIDKLTSEKDLNESRISQGVFFLEQQYRPFEREAKREAQSAIVNLINNCEFGLFFAQKMLLKVKKDLRKLLEEIRSEKARCLEEKTINEAQFNQGLLEIEKSLSRRLSLFKKTQINKKSAQMASNLRLLTEAALTAKILEKKQALLQILVGQEQVVEERLVGEEIVVEKRIQKSLVDQEIDKINRLIEKLSFLGDRAEEKAKEGRLSQADQGVTITTQIFPPKIFDFLNSPALRSVYEREIKATNIHEHVKTILQRLNESSETDGRGIYGLSVADKELVVKKVLISLTAQHIQNLFKDLLSQSVIEVAVDSIGETKFEEQIMANLFELSQPCWNYDLQKAHDPGVTELPRTYSLGYRDPDSLPIPEGVHKPGLVQTDDNYQITLLQCQHGLPLFALRPIPTLRADYKRYMHLAKTSGNQPLHLQQLWTKDIDSLPDLKAPVRVGDEVLKDFALGLFTDYLVSKRDPFLQRFVKKRSIYKGEVRGYVYTTDGRNYFFTNLKKKAEGFEIVDAEQISSSGRIDAAEAFANRPDLGKSASELVRSIEKKKQYDFLSDLEEYLEKILAPEVMRLEDEEERNLLQREYEVLQHYLEELNYQRKRGLPLAG